MNYKTINFDEVLAWCFENGQEAWLEEQLAKHGNSFLPIKEAFVLKFMPEIKPPKKEKPLSMMEKFNLRKNA